MDLWSPDVGRGCITGCVLPEAGILDLKARLGAYLREFQAAETAFVTRHGKSIGGLVPLTQSTEAQLDNLSQAGLIAWNKEKLTSLAPIAQARSEHTVADLPPENRA